MTITLTREEAQQVLDAFQGTGTSAKYQQEQFESEIKAMELIEARLAQPEPEPVAWIKKDRSSIEVSIMSAEYMKNAGFEPLYTAPPQREWQALTDEEIEKLFMWQEWSEDFAEYEPVARAIEAKLKEKNG
jgi:hypothetical protein